MGKKLVLLTVAAVTAIISGCATQEAAPAPSLSTPEFRCEEDMPCFFPEMRVSEAEDIALCEAGYEGYRAEDGYEPLAPCLEEVEHYWAGKN